MKKKTGLKIINTAAYLVMITFSFLADFLPLNGVTTGEVAAAYPNLFTPAGFTFMIWGLIYLLLGAFVLYQWGFFGAGEDQRISDIIEEISPYFILSSFANAMWIIAWHNFNVGISVIIMVVLFIALTVIYLRLSNECFTAKQSFFIKFPFSIYYGWIAVALIANITALLVDIGWNGWGLSDAAWTVIMIAVSCAVGLLVMLRYHDKAYGAVVLWAIIGILAKHLSVNGFDKQYPGVIVAASVAIAALILGEYLLISGKKR